MKIQNAWSQSFLKAQAFCFSAPQSVTCSYKSKERSQIRAVGRKEEKSLLHLASASLKTTTAIVFTLGKYRQIIIILSWVLYIPAKLPFQLFLKHTKLSSPVPWYLSCLLQHSFSPRWTWLSCFSDSSPNFFKPLSSSVKAKKWCHFSWSADEIIQ